MTYRELIGQLPEHVTAFLLRRGSIGPKSGKSPDDQVDPETLELAQSMAADPGSKIAGGVTRTAPPAEEEVVEESVEEQVVEEPKEAAPSIASIENKLLADEPGGVYQYTLTATSDGEVKTNTFSKKRPLSDADVELIQKITNKNFGTADAEVSKTVADAPFAILKSLIDRGIIEAPTDEFEQFKMMSDIADNPSAFRALAMDEDPASMKNTLLAMGDEVSWLGRSLAAKATTEDDAPAGAELLSMAKLTPKSKGFWGSMVEGAARSPVTPVSLATAPLVGGSTLLGKMAAQGAAGAFETAGDMAIQEQQGLVDYSGADYALGSGIGGALGAGITGAVDAAPAAIRAYNAREPGSSFISSLARDLRTEKGALAAKAKAKSKAPVAESFDTGRIDYLEETLGVDAADIYPGATVKDKGSAAAEQFKGASQNIEDMAQSHKQTYGLIEDVIDVDTGFRAAPTKEQAGVIASDGMKAAEDAMFKEADFRYSNVVDDPNIALGVDQALQGDIAMNLASDLKDFSSSLWGQIPHKSVFDPKTKRWVNVATKGAKGVRSRVIEAADQIDETLEILYSLDNPNLQPGFVLKNLEYQRRELQQLLSKQNDPDFALPPAGYKAVKETYGKIAEAIQDATTKYNPELGARLAEGNAKQADFFDLRNKISKALNSSNPFNALTASDANMKTLREALSLYGQAGAFDKFRDGWFAATIAKGNRDTLDSNTFNRLTQKGNKEAVMEFYSPAVYDRLYQLTDSLDKMGNVRQRSALGGLVRGTGSTRGKGITGRALSTLGNVFGATKSQIPEARMAAYENVMGGYVDALRKRRGFKPRQRETKLGGALAQLANYGLERGRLSLGLDPTANIRDEFEAKDWK